jgi:hypothetical protein
MNLSKASTIDEVIFILENIIIESKENNDPLGYFAALYQKVTIKVKDEIQNGFFDDGPRMEKLDVVFANRYLNAYFLYKEKREVTASWSSAFNLSTHYWPIVIQHLLMGMNAHINFDLGICAAEISKGKDINDLENDFNKINEILSSQLENVQKSLLEIWPSLKWILKLIGKVDDFLVDFSMKLAREGAWKFAKELVGKPQTEQMEFRNLRDEKVAKKSKIVSNPGVIVQIIFAIIRIGERGSVANKIHQFNI